MLSDKDMRERMRNGWWAGRPYTTCGNGTLPQHSKNVRPALSKWIAKYGIAVVNDAGAGDKRLVPNVHVYRPYDLFPRSPGITALDITTEVMPPCDLIVCRMVLNHLWGDDGDATRVEMALDLFRKSGKYLAATQYHGKSLPQRSKQFHRLDLTRWLGNPIESVRDGAEDFCWFSLWRLSEPV